MKTIPNILCCLSVAGLGACASISYQEPTSGPRARVRFAADTHELTVLRVYDDPGCTVNETEWMRLRAGPLLNSEPKSLGLPLGERHHPNAAKEVYVSVDKPVHALMIWSGGGGGSCGVPFEYAFQADRDYEVSFAVNPVNPNRFECQVSISEIAPKPEGGFRYVEAARFDQRVTEANHACMAAFKAQRLY